MQTLDVIELIEGRGIVGDHRYFERISKTTGKLSQRQVSLMEREEIATHATALGLTSIAPGAVRANIETTGFNLLPLLGGEIRIGETVLFLCMRRDPCGRMDAVAPGLRDRMKGGHQGVLAEIRQSGKVRPGDAVYLHSHPRASVEPASVPQEPKVASP